MKEEEFKASQGADNNTIDPMIVDTGNNQPSPEGMYCINYFGANINYFGANIQKCFPFLFYFHYKS